MEKKTLFRNEGCKSAERVNTEPMSDSVNPVDFVAIGRARVIKPAGTQWNDWFEGDDVSVDFMATRHQT